MSESPLFILDIILNNALIVSYNLFFRHQIFNKCYYVHKYIAKFLCVLFFTLNWFETHFHFLCTTDKAMITFLGKFYKLFFSTYLAWFSFSYHN